MTALEGAQRVAPGTRFAIVCTRWNPRIVDALVDGAHRALREHGVGDDRIDVVRVPGAWEIPIAVEHLAREGRVAAVIALGCVVRGDTRHYEHVADECARGLMRVQLDHALPVCNGVLAVEKHEDAVARAGGAHGNKGEEAARAAIEMADLLRGLATRTRSTAA